MSDYRIESIKLKDIGVFDDVQIDFPKIESAEADEKKAEIHLFTGPNGSGKSTLLYALACGFCLKDIEHKVSDRIKSKSSELNVCFGGERVDILFEKFLESGIVSFSNQSRLMSYSVLTSMSHIVDVSFNFFACAYSGRRTLNEVKVLNASKVEDSPFEGALSFEGDTYTNDINQWVLSKTSEANAAEVAGEKEEAEAYRYAIKRIETFIKDVCGKDIKFQLKRSPLTVKMNVDDELLDFDVLPDGLKSIISWVADLARRLDCIPWAEQRDIFSQNIILFLDEIDIHLHPKWQRRILPAVQKLLPNAQIFASTHSPFVVGSVEDAWVYKLPEKGQQTERVITPIKSSPAKSYALILEEVFGVDKDFGLEVESLLNEFYQYRNAFLKDKSKRNDLVNTAKMLLNKKSEEITAIIGRELRQIQRLTGEELSLA